MDIMPLHPVVRVFLFDTAPQLLRLNAAIPVPVWYWMITIADPCWIYTLERVVIVRDFLRKGNWKFDKIVEKMTE